jgi:cytochrome c oxidase assembly protein subunit 15
MSRPLLHQSRLPLLAWTAVGWTVAVSVWGAFVRATGSGAGCGNNWPLCDGAVFPGVSSAATLIEFSHRITSGVALLVVVALWVAVRGLMPRGSLAHRAAAASVVFILIEAAIGAGLVLLELVGDDASIARAIVIGGHLVNTFALVATLTVTAWAITGRMTIRWLGGSASLLLMACAAALLLTNASGAIAALGDTLFPARSLFEAWRQELSVTSNVLIRLRLLHPIIALGTAAGVSITALSLDRTTRGLTPYARALVGLVGVQLAAGAINVLLLAPIWLQLVHLLLANAVWIAFILVAANTLSTPTDGARTGAAASDGTRPSAEEAPGGGAGGAHSHPS